MTGLTGSGKTFIMTKIINEEWRKNHLAVWANYPIFFSDLNEDITRYDSLPEIYHIKNGILAIDEGQKLFDARRWASLPPDFMEKICQHRKHFLDIYTTTQDIRQIDLRVRINIHNWFKCEKVFRYPFNDSKPAKFMWIRRVEMIKEYAADDRQLWKRGKVKWYFITPFTKKLYDTYADVGMSRYIMKLCRKNKKTKMIIANRSLVNRGKVRL